MSFEAMVEGFTAQSQSTLALATSPPHNPSDISSVLSLETKPLSSTQSFQTNLPLSPPTEPSPTPPISEHFGEDTDSLMAAEDVSVVGDEAKVEVIESVVMDVDIAVPVKSLGMDLDVQESAHPSSSIPSQSIASRPPLAPTTVSSLSPADMKACKSILSSLQKHKSSWPFHVPVDPVIAQAPDYYNIIKNPMDLQTAGQKLSAGSYTTLQAFVEDVKLIFDNCFFFNPPTHFVHQLGRQLEKYFSNLLNRTFPLLPIYNRQAEGQAVPVKKASTKVSTSSAQKRKRDSLVPAETLGKEMVSSPVSNVFIDIDGDGGEPFPPITTAAPEVIRSARERKPKKIYEPEDLRRPSEDADGKAASRRKSISKAAKKKSESDLLGGTFAASLMLIQQQLEGMKKDKSKKHKVRKTEALLTSALTAMAFSGLVNNNDSSSDSSSDEESQSKAAKRSAGASAAAARRSKVGDGSVAEIKGGSSSRSGRGNKRCEHCDTSSTPHWRKGPSGSHSLCNTCGIVWKEAGNGKPQKRRRPSGTSSPGPSAPTASSVNVPPRTICWEEKSKLSEIIGSLSDRHQMGVIEIIRTGMPQLGANGGEIELDLDALDPVTLAKLADHVYKCVDEDKRNSEKAKEAARRAACALRREREGAQSSDSESGSGSDSDSD